MKRIKLNNSSDFAIIDDEFYSIIVARTWTKTNFGHAVTNIGGTNVFMHRLILNTDLPEVDHIDGNGLNNQLSNLRGATRSQNCANRRKFKGEYSSQYKGVSKQRDRVGWRTVIKLNNKKISLGVFKTEIAAAKAYDRKAKELFGEFAQLNFPPNVVCIERKVS